MNVLVKAGAVAAAGLAVLLAAGCATSRPAPAKGSVQACIAFGVRAIDEHRTVTQVPAACRGLSRAEVNFALGRAIYLVAGTGHHKVAWRHDAAVAGTRLARLITTAMAQSPGGIGRPVPAARAARPGPVDRRPLGVATLIAWLLTMAAGGYMLLRFVIWRRAAAAAGRRGPHRLGRGAHPFQPGLDRVAALGPLPGDQLAGRGLGRGGAAAAGDRVRHGHPDRLDLRDVPAPRPARPGRRRPGTSGVQCRPGRPSCRPGRPRRPMLRPGRPRRGAGQVQVAEAGDQAQPARPRPPRRPTGRRPAG